MHVRCLRFMITVAASALLSQSAAASPILYSQPPDAGACGDVCSTSDVDAAGNGFQVYDDFTLGADFGIDAVSWRGFYWDALTPANNPMAPDTTSWDIQFYADAAGTPGALLHTTSLAAAAVTTTFVFNDTIFRDTVPVYDFHAALPVAFAATGGTKYWVSVLAHSPTLNPLFSWTGGSGGDGFSVQDWLSPPNTRTVVTDDRAFALEGSVAAIPEPGSLTLIGLGLSALAARRRLLRQTR
jgi:hypothetical protein